MCSSSSIACRRCVPLPTGSSVYRFRLKSVLQQDLLRLQRIGGVGGVDDDGVALDVCEVLDAVLHIEFVGAAVAAGDDDDIHFGDVDHGHRVVDRGMGDIDRAVASPWRWRSEFSVNCRSISIRAWQKSAVNAGIERQRAGGTEDIDVQQDRLGGRRCGGEGPDIPTMSAETGKRARPNCETSRLKPNGYAN